MCPYKRGVFSVCVCGAETAMQHVRIERCGGGPRAPSQACLAVLDLQAPVGSNRVVMTSSILLHVSA